MNKQEKDNMKTPMQKPIINAEAFMKFFEETTGAKFVDAKTLPPVEKAYLENIKLLGKKAEKKVKKKS